VTARTLTGHSPGALRYDLIAIGSGPAAQGAAVQAAKLGKRDAVVERQGVLGGASTSTGTVPSKTLRAAIVELTGTAPGVYGPAYGTKNELTIGDLFWRTHQVIEHEQAGIHDLLRRNGIDILWGTASLLDAHTLEIASPEGSYCASADHLVIAVGTRPSRRSHVEFDDRTVLDSDEIVLVRYPADAHGHWRHRRQLRVRVHGRPLGTRVTLVDRGRSPLEFVDDEIVAALRYYLSGLGVVFRLGDDVDAVEGTAGGVLTRFRSGERIRSEPVLYAAGRHRATAELNLAAAGVEADACGRIAAGPHLRTDVRHILRPCEVGLQRLAATSKEQGRLAALAAFGQPVGSGPSPLPTASSPSRRSLSLARTSVI
jgi:NAD(P) transhydrogenase